MDGLDSQDPAVGSLWLNRESDVVAHLFFAAAEIGEVTVQVAGEEVTAALAFPRTDSRSVVVVIKDTASEVPFRPVAGAVVRVTYRRGQANYSWLTGVIEATNPRQWILSYPATIERNERRIVSRHRVLGRAGFKLRLDTGDGVERSLPLYDMSAAGLGFIHRPDLREVVDGASLRGTLVLPDGETVEVELEVANLRPVPGGGRDRVVGCRFASLTATGQARIAQSLAEYDTVHG
ncbi:MAG: PilZ domain-containing protein [Myxococcota bacterium]|nr:PilZ domain-containing protein [Myxococcota bacterium]